MLVLLPIILLCLCSCGWGAELPAAKITFPPHPRVAYTAPELAAWKGDAARAGEVSGVITRAKGILAAGLQVPQQSGQWIFYYACPLDGARLRAETPEKHVCPTCGKTYADERTQAAYRTLLNNQLDDRCVTLALAYAFTGEEPYAAAVRGALLELARLYPTFERHDRWGRRGAAAVVGGCRYAQLLDESYGVIYLAKAYDLAASATCFSAADRQKIEQLLGSIAREVLQYQAFAGLKNNHQTWFNASYTVVGLAIGDELLMREGVYGAHGLCWQMEASVTSDGFWYEGAMAYQRYAMQAIVETLDAARRVGWDFAGDARVKSLWLGPLRMAYPDGRFPVFHDSDPADLSGWRDMYRWGQAYFNDASFAPYTGTAPVKSVPLASADLSGIGVVSLRRGAGAQAVCAMVDYGQHGDHHGHPDKLNLVLYALGREILLDPGRISYSVPEYESWCRTTVAHNTVVINGDNQQPDMGRLLYFTENDRYAAAFTASDGAYPGFSLRRFVLLTGKVLVDVFVVEGQREAQLDWLLHIAGTPEVLPPAESAAPTLGNRNGFQHLADLHAHTAGNMPIFTYALADGRRYRIWCPDGGQSTLITGVGIGYRLTDRIPFLLRRRTARAAVFIAVYDLSGGEGLQQVERVPLQGAGASAAETAGIGLRLHWTDHTELVALDLRAACPAPLHIGGKPIERCLLE